MNCLDKTGLTYFWTKIKEFLNTNYYNKIEINNKLNNISGGITETVLYENAEGFLGSSWKNVSLTETKENFKRIYINYFFTNDSGNKIQKTVQIDVEEGDQVTNLEGYFWTDSGATLAREAVDVKLSGTTLQYQHKSAMKISTSGNTIKGSTIAITKVYGENYNN